MSDLDLGLDFLLAQSGPSLLAIFWYTVLFEIPRYGLAFLAAAIAPAVIRLWNRGPEAGSRLEALRLGQA